MDFVSASSLSRYRDSIAAARRLEAERLLLIEEALLHYLDVRDQIALTASSPAEAFALLQNICGENSLSLTAPPSGENTLNDPRYARWRSVWSVILNKLNLNEVRALSSRVFCQSDPSSRILRKALFEHVAMQSDRAILIAEFLEYFAFIEQKEGD